eukprot:278278_1
MAYKSNKDSHYKVAIESVKCLEHQLIELGANPNSKASVKLNQVITMHRRFPKSLEMDIRDILSIRNAMCHQENCQQIPDPYAFVTKMASVKLGLSLIRESKVRNTPDPFQEALTTGYTFITDDKHKKLREMQKRPSDLEEQFNPKFKITIRHASCTDLDVLVRSDDTIYKVKQKLRTQNVNVVPPQVLMNGRSVRLDDDKTLDFYRINMQSGWRSKILFLRAPKGNIPHHTPNVQQKNPPNWRETQWDCKRYRDATMSIVVVMLSGLKIQLNVTANDTVANVKEKVYEKSGIDPAIQNFTRSVDDYAMLLQDDDWTLSHYGVQQDDTIRMVSDFSANLITLLQ